jgi:Domain of unknown function (DUF4386)
MTQSRLERLAPLSGVVFVVLLIVAIILGGETPGIDDSAQEIVDYYADNQDELVAGALIMGLSCVFLVWFASTLRATLRLAGERAERLATLAYTGFVLGAIGLLSFTGFTIAAADAADKDASADVLVTLNALNNDFFAPLAVGLLVSMLASAIAILRYGGLPRWMGWAAIVILVLQVTPLFFAAYPLLGLWIIAAAILMFGQSPAPEARPPAQTPS